MTIPETKVRVVDAETGKPQEWVYVSYSAGRNVADIAGQSWNPVYIREDHFFRSQDGWVTIPSASSTSATFRNVDCWVQVESPGHEAIEYTCDDFLRLARTSSKVITVSLKPMKDPGFLNNQLLSPRNANLNYYPHTYEATMYRLTAYEELLTKWDAYYAMDKRPLEGGYAFYMMTYFRCAVQNEHLSTEQNAQVRQRVCSFYDKEFQTHRSIKDEIEKFNRELGAMFLKEANCESK